MRFCRNISALGAAALLVGCGSSGGGGHTGGGGVTPPSGTAVKVTFSSTYAQPLAVAVQIGAGAWAAATPQGGTLSFTVPSGTAKYAVAFACPPALEFGTIVQNIVIEATTSDPVAYTASCYGPPATSAVTGSVNAAAIAGTTQVGVFGNLGYGSFVSSPTGNFSSTMLTGNNDVAVAAEDAANDVLGVKIVRNQSAPGAINGGSPVTLAATDATTSQTIAVTNISAGFNPSPAVDAVYYTANGTQFGIIGHSSTIYRAVPASEAVAGDYYNFSANTANLTTHELLGISENAAGGGPISLAMPAPWTYTAPVAAKFPTFTFAYTGFSGDAAVDDLAQVSWPANATMTDDVSVYATAAYQGSASTVAIPNLGALAGFLAAPPSGTSVNWLMEITGGTYFEFQLKAPPSASLSFVQATGSFTEP